MMRVAGWSSIDWVPIWLPADPSHKHLRFDLERCSSARLATQAALAL